MKSLPRIDVNKRVLMENLTVDEAIASVVAPIEKLKTEKVDIRQADYRILGEDIISPINLPLFANSAMDGYALIAADSANASKEHPVLLRIINHIPAGSISPTKVLPGQASRIMTGAPIPPGADTVVKFEDTDNAHTGHVQVYVPVEAGGYIRLPGEDLDSGQRALKKGTVLQPAAIGLLAALGYFSVSCVRRPRVAIMSTGDELVVPGFPLRPGKIYDCNSYMVAALAREYGADVKFYGQVLDQEQSIREKINDIMADGPDLIVSSGGVSTGDYDLIRNELVQQGQIDFWQIRMRPGRPLAFGNMQGIPFLGLPGNPVAAFVSFFLYGRAILYQLQGRDPKPTYQQAICAEPVRNGSNKRHFLRGVLSTSDSRMFVQLAGGQLPNQFSTLAHSNCLVVAHEERALYEIGEEIPVLHL